MEVTTTMDDVREEVRDGDSRLNWNPQWYFPLRDLARYVIRHYNITLYDEDELVTIAWLHCASRFNIEEGVEAIYRNRKNICGKMVYAAFGYSRKPSNAGYVVWNAGNTFEDPVIETGNTRKMALCLALADSHDYENGVDTLDLLQALYKRISKMQQSLVLLLLEGYSQAEISEKWGMKLFVVRNNIMDVRWHLTRLLKECENPNTGKVD